MNYYELETSIEEWAENKGILKHGTPIAQIKKTKEEVEELRQAILLNDKDEIALELGDCLVTLIIQAKMQSLSITECLELVYEKISKRTGHMENGEFVKDKQ